MCFILFVVVNKLCKSIWKRSPCYVFLHIMEAIEVTQEINSTGIIPLEALRVHLPKRPHKDEEDMEVDEWALGKTDGARMAASTSTRCSYRHPKATYTYPRQDQTPGSPRSIHTDTDVAMEMGGLGMGTSRSETCRVMPQTEALPEQTRMLSAPDLVSSLTQILEKFTHHTGNTSRNGIFHRPGLCI